MYKVVIIDDEPDVIRKMTNTLPWKKWDCKIVATACDGEEGQKIIRQYKPDMVFLEIDMQKVNGLKMIENLKMENINFEISILTREKNFESAQRAVNIGVRRFLLKPFQEGQIEDAVEAMKANVNGRKMGYGQNKSEEVSSFIVNDAIGYIETHYEERLTLAEVAEHTYVSQWHLSKLLNKEVKQNFSEILNRTRIRHAKELLADRTLRIGDIAEMVGFLDIAHFSRVFKKFEGVSANEYRTSLQKNENIIE